jgi:plastocyanin
MPRVVVSVLFAVAILFSFAPALPAEASCQLPWMGMGGTGFGCPVGTTTVGTTQTVSSAALPRGCGRGPDPQNVRASAISELPRVTIGIHDGFFLPAEISVAPGTVVVWRNMGSNPHTTTAWNRWDSGVMRPGDACMAWFVTPGSYDYLSIVAADGGTMTGTVTVEGTPIGGGSAGMGTGAGTMPMMPGMGTMGAGY